MTENSTAPVENVGRGTTFALLAIPIAVAAFALIGGLLGLITGIIAIAVPYVASWLYNKGAGTALTRKGWLPFIVVAAAAVILGTFAGIVGSVYAAYSSVGGDGGIFAPAFWTTVGRQLTSGLEDNLLAILIGLGLGGAGIVSVLRGGTLGRRATPAADAAAPAYPATPAAPLAPPAASTPLPPVPNAPSPGVILNGTPVDPDAKK